MKNEANAGGEEDHCMWFENDEVALIVASKRMDSVCCFIDAKIEGSSLAIKSD